MATPTVKALLGGGKQSSWTEITVPQLEYKYPNFKSAGIAPLEFGRVFYDAKGRYPRPDEKVRFVFQENLRYRGAFGWLERNQIIAGGQSYDCVPKPRASFLLGMGWSSGQYPKQMELYIPPTCKIFGASGCAHVGLAQNPGLFRDVPIYSPPLTVDSVPSSIFSLVGTQPFINANTPLIFNHQGKIFAAGGTGTSTKINTQALPYGPVAVRSATDWASGGVGKGWPSASKGPSEYFDNNIDVYTESTVDANEAFLNTGNGGQPTTGVAGYLPVVVRESAANLELWKYRHISIWAGSGGGWGQKGTGCYISHNEGTSNGNVNYKAVLPNSGSIPGAVFDLANFTAGTSTNASEFSGSNIYDVAVRFPNWASLAACLDFSKATGQINLADKSSWSVAPVAESFPGNGYVPPSWSWLYMMYRDRFGITDTTLFGSAYNPTSTWLLAPGDFKNNYPAVYS